MQKNWSKYNFSLQNQYTAKWIGVKSKYIDQL